MFCENLISRVKPIFIYKNEIYPIENQRFFLQYQQSLRMIAIPTLSISRIIALWCIFWSMTKNQGICQQCHPRFSPPLFSKSLLTVGWCFTGILGRASLTEGPIYCRQTIDTVRLILCFTCRPVHPGLGIWPWPLRSLLVDLEICWKHPNIWKLHCELHLICTILVQKDFDWKTLFWHFWVSKNTFDFPHKIGHIFVDEVFNSTLRVAISRKEIELLYSFPCAMPGPRAKMIHSNLDLIKICNKSPDKDYLGERRRGPTMVGDKQGHKSAGYLERGTQILN